MDSEDDSDKEPESLCKKKKWSWKRSSKIGVKKWQIGWQERVHPQTRRFNEEYSDASFVIKI